MRTKISALLLGLALMFTGVLSAPTAQAAGNNWLQLTGNCGVDISPNYGQSNWYYQYLPSGGYSPYMMPNVRAFRVTNSCTVYDIGRGWYYKTGIWHVLPYGAGLGYYLRVNYR